MEAFNVQNIVQGNGLAISITGMAIVFSGLIIITLFIRILPSLLGLSFKKQLQETTSSKSEISLASGAASAGSAETTVDEGEDKDIASLIGLVLHLEQERLFHADNQYITMNRNNGQRSLWGTTGQMRSAPHRRSYAKV